MARYQLDGTKVIDRRRNEVARFMLEETARSACQSNAVEQSAATTNRRLAICDTEPASTSTAI